MSKPMKSAKIQNRKGGLWSAEMNQDVSRSKEVVTTGLSMDRVLTCISNQPLI